MYIINNKARANQHMSVKDCAKFSLLWSCRDKSCTCPKSGWCPPTCCLCASEHKSRLGSWEETETGSPALLTRHHCLGTAPGNFQAGLALKSICRIIESTRYNIANDFLIYLFLYLLPRTDMSLLQPLF